MIYRMRYFLIPSACFAALLAAAGNASAQVGTTLLEENFDSLITTLGGSVNEREGTALSTLPVNEPGTTPVPNVFSPTAPGWTVDNTLGTYDGSATITPGVAGAGVAGYGVDEWEGWGFVNKDFWVAADDQDRSQFGVSTGASGTIAVADPDEYFDIDLGNGSTNDPVNGGYYSSSMTSAPFPVTGGNFYGVGFDSSWRDEAFDDNALNDTFLDLNNQAVEVIVSFDTGDTVQVTKWNSDSSDAFFKDDAPDENFAADGIALPFVEAPAGATSATLTFALANAGNDWWWAVDNIEVNDLNTSSSVYSEDFEGVTLGDSVNERLQPGGKVTIDSDGVSTIAGVDYPTAPRADSFTHTPPTGWTVDNTGTPNIGDEASDDVGVFEFEQFAFVTPEFWTFVDEQGREDFTKGTGVIAVADGDEWDDLGDPGDNGDLTTFFETPVIDVTGLDRVRLEFDSSWRAEDDQTASVIAVLDGVEEEVLLWVSDDTSEFFHDDNTNESVAFGFNTNGATELSLKFSYVGNNDWWWAVDNIRVAAVPEPSAGLLAALFGCVFGFVRRR